MIRFLVCATLLVLATSVSAGEPFTVIQGRGVLSPKQPQACVSVSGAVHLTFGVGEQIYLMQLNGPSKAEPKAVFEIPNLSLGMRRGPRIAQSGDSLVITAIGGKVGKGKDGDLVSYHSHDEGKTWNGPIRVNDVESSAREGLHAMTVSPAGVFWCVWLDLREEGTQLFASKSMDGGLSWSKNVRVYRSPDGSICECCHPSIVAGKDSLHVLFRNSIKGDRDMYLISSLDGSETFAKAIRLGLSHWHLNACPMDGGMIAIDRTQKLLTVWRRDKSVFHAGAEINSEAFVENGEQPWVVGGNNGFYSIWISKRNGDLMLLKPGSTEITKLDDVASFPVVVANTQPEDPVFAFWEKQSGDSFSIMAQRLK